MKQQQKKITYIAKILLSGVIAFLLLTGFAYFYYNIPVRVTCEDGATDYTWTYNTVYHQNTEGFSQGKTNNEGYMNRYDYVPGMPIDILLMGSSHMEAKYVAVNESTASRLNEMLGEGSVYNLGLSAHNFANNVQNLERAINKYQPGEYVFLETMSTYFSAADLEQMLTANAEPVPVHNSGIASYLQYNPYLRLVYRQVAGMGLLANNDQEETVAVTTAEKENGNTDELLDQLLGKVRATVAESGAKLVIFYHPDVKLKKDGSITLLGNKEATEQFRMACEANDIIFLNLGDRILQEYEENHVLPYGFPNTSVGYGHLNKYGHQMLVGELYRIITEGTS